jgi:solute carrier family 25 (adenine nucleotide translocator) protein 4/5/6/31
VAYKAWENTSPIFPSMARPVAFAAAEAPAAGGAKVEAKKKEPERNKAGKILVKLSFVEDFILSGFAAVVSKTISAPIERLKMLMQNQDELIRAGKLDKPFRGPVDCTMYIYNQEGFSSFWKSNFTNCVRYFPTQALNFAFKGQLKKIDALAPKKADNAILALTKNIIGGGLAGGGSLVFVYSLDYARTRLANDLNSEKKGAKKAKDAAAAGAAEGAKKEGAAPSGRQFTGLLDVYRKTWASDGIAGLYRGFVISFVGIFIYRGVYFGLYDTVMNRWFPPEYTNLYSRFALGYVVTVLAGLASYPIDTIRRRMMMTSGAKGLQYSGSIDCFRKIVTNPNEGWRSLFKGAGANILRGVAGAGVLAGFDTVVEVYVKNMYGAEYAAVISGGGG